MLESFHQTARRFTELVDRLKDCHDAETRKQLLSQMLLTVDEADALIEIRQKEVARSKPK